jgi:hypothetical protein
MAPIPRRPRPQAVAAYTNATAHPQRARHRTTRRKSGNVWSPGSCRPHLRVRRPDTNAPVPRSGLLPWARSNSCRHSTRIGLRSVKSTADPDCLLVKGPFFCRGLLARLAGNYTAQFDSYIVVFTSCKTSLLSRCSRPTVSRNAFRNSHSSASPLYARWTLATSP